MGKHRGRRLAAFSALVAIALLVVGLFFFDAMVEQYYLYRLRGDDVEQRDGAYAKLVEMGSTKAIGPIIRQRIEAKKPTYDGLVDIAVKSPKAFATTVQRLVRHSGDRAIRCFAAYVLSEIAWRSEGAVAALEPLRADEDPVVKLCAEVGVQEIERKLESAPKGRARVGLVVEESQLGLTIRDIIIGSPAARVDLRTGDTLEMLNDVDVSRLQDMVNTLKGASTGEFLPLRVRRGDKTVTTHIIPDSKSSWAPVLPMVWEGEQKTLRL